VITGNINPNPKPTSFGQGSVVISWETNDPAGADVRVWTSFGEERLVSRGHSGTVEIPLIEQSAEYSFRVNGASQPDVPLDTVKVRRESSGNILSELTTEVMRGNVDPVELS